MTDNNIKHLITRKTLGIDQLEQFDSQGTPGPPFTGGRFVSSGDTDRG